MLLDPVYSDKGMAGLIDLCRKGFFGKGQNIVFVHTGGSTALYGYKSDFLRPESRAAACVQILEVPVTLIARPDE